MKTNVNGKFLPLLIAVFCLFFLTLLFSVAVHTPTTASGFPNVVADRKVEWVPDKKIRYLAENITPHDVEEICMYGRGSTGMPTAVHVRSKKNIALILNSLKSAVRLKTSWVTIHDVHEAGMGGPEYHTIEPDRCEILLYSTSAAFNKFASHNNDLSFLFYSDIYEGTEINMQGGRSVLSFRMQCDSWVSPGREHKRARFILFAVSNGYFRSST